MSESIRSETMNLYKVTMSSEVVQASKAIEAFGHLNAVHFVDINKNESPLELKHNQAVKRCS